jgi:hypothetical protein
VGEGTGSQGTMQQQLENVLARKASVLQSVTALESALEDARHQISDAVRVRPRPPSSPSALSPSLLCLSLRLVVVPRPSPCLLVSSSACLLVCASACLLVLAAWACWRWYVSGPRRCLQQERLLVLPLCPPPLSSPPSHPDLLARALYPYQPVYHPTTARQARKRLQQEATALQMAATEGRG